MGASAREGKVLLLLKSGESYDGKTFEGGQVEVESLEGVECEDCSFKEVDFCSAELYRCSFIRCTFEACTLRMIPLSHSRFVGVRFRTSNLVGLDWTRADWGARIRVPLSFTDCTLNHATFYGLTLDEWVIRDCLAVDVDFREASLKEVDFQGTDLRESLFHQSDLRGADLRRARNYQIAPGENQIEGASFALPEALSLLNHLGIQLVGEFD